MNFLKLAMKYFSGNCELPSKETMFKVSNNLIKKDENTGPLKTRENVCKRKLLIETKPTKLEPKCPLATHEIRDKT